MNNSIRNAFAVALLSSAALIVTPAMAQVLGGGGAVGGTVGGIGGSAGGMGRGGLNGVPTTTNDRHQWRRVCQNAVDGTG